MPTTSVRRRTSLFNRSCGLFDQIWRQCSLGKVAKAKTSGPASASRPACPIAQAVTIARVDAVSAALAELRPAGLLSLGGHQLLGDRGHHFAQQIGVRLLELLAQPG